MYDEENNVNSNQTEETVNDNQNSNNETNGNVNGNSEQSGSYYNRGNTNNNGQGSYYNSGNNSYYAKPVGRYISSQTPPKKNGVLHPTSSHDSQIGEHL